MSKFDRNENPNWKPDALVEVTFTERKIPALNGYRPAYRVLKDYFTTTHHWFIETGQALPKEPTKAFVKFITPEAYPKCLKQEMIIDVTEGSKVIGNSKVIEVYNEELRKDS